MPQLRAAAGGRRAARPRTAAADGRVLLAGDAAVDAPDDTNITLVYYGTLLTMISFAPVTLKVPTFCGVVWRCIMIIILCI